MVNRTKNHAITAINHQLIPIAIKSKSISYEQTSCNTSQGIAVTSLYCLLFSTSKNKDLKRISKSTTNAVLPLKFIWTPNFILP